MHEGCVFGLDGDQVNFVPACLTQLLLRGFGQVVRPQTHHVDCLGGQQVNVPSHQLGHAVELDGIDVDDGHAGRCVFVDGVRPAGTP